MLIGDAMIVMISPALVCVRVCHSLFEVNQKKHRLLFKMRKFPLCIIFTHCQRKAKDKRNPSPSQGGPKTVVTIDGHFRGITKTN
jgi:hypothetical protein